MVVLYELTLLIPNIFADDVIATKGNPLNKLVEALTFSGCGLDGMPQVPYRKGKEQKDGRAMAGLLSVFAEFEREIHRERVMAGLAQARSKGIQLGRPQTAALMTIAELYREGFSQAGIARKLAIGRTSVRRILAAAK